MERPRIRPVFLLVLAGVALVWGLAIVMTRPVVIDGIPLGGQAACEERVCQQFIDFAMVWLDGDDPAHAEVRDVEVRETNYRDAHGKRLPLPKRSGNRGDWIVVLHLADRTSWAVHVSCGMGVAADLCFASSGPPHWRGSEPISVPVRP